MFPSLGGTPGRGFEGVSMAGDGAGEGVALPVICGVDGSFVFFLFFCRGNIINEYHSLSLFNLIP